MRHHLIDQQDFFHDKSCCVRSFELFVLSLDSMKTGVRKTAAEHPWEKNGPRWGRRWNTHTIERINGWRWVWNHLMATRVSLIVTWWMWDCLLGKITWISLRCHIPGVSYKLNHPIFSRCVTLPVSDFIEDFRDGIDWNPLGNVHHWQPSPISGFTKSNVTLSVRCSLGVTPSSSDGNWHHFLGSHVHKQWGFVNQGLTLSGTV